MPGGAQSWYRITVTVSPAACGYVPAGFGVSAPPWATTAEPIVMTQWFGVAAAKLPVVDPATYWHVVGAVAPGTPAGADATQPFTGPAAEAPGTPGVAPAAAGHMANRLPNATAPSDRTTVVPSQVFP
jgi:hypothetical protein